MAYITNLKPQQVIDFVQQNVISYSQLKEWYLITGKIPSVETCNLIYRYGTDPIVELWKRNQPKIDLKSIIEALNKLGY